MDEIYRKSNSDQEDMLTFLEDQRHETDYGYIENNHITIGATTKPHNIITALRDRFPITPEYAPIGAERGAMNLLRITEEPIDRLHEYATISIAFVVERVLAVSLSDTPGPFTLSEIAVEHPWVKDYDALEPPMTWLQRFDTHEWGLLVAYEAGVRVGGAIVIPEAPMKATLWDLRVETEFRSAGVGSALFHAAERWSWARGCRRLEVETQNVNAPACFFYARMGCRLESVEAEAYPDLPGEARIVWAKDLDSN